MKQLITRKLNLSEEQQKQIKKERTKAVNEAWKREKTLVENGKGTRDWTKEQQEKILKDERVPDFQGQHMRSVSYGKTFEERLSIAGNKNDIQFLEATKDNNEHLKAHSGNWKNVTNGYYDVKTGKMNDFGKGEPHMPPIKKLSNPVCKQEQKNENVENIKVENNVKNNYSRSR